MSFSPDVYERLPIEPVHGEGAELVLADGRRILDFYAGHAVVLPVDDRDVVPVLRHRVALLREPQPTGDQQHSGGAAHERRAQRRGVKVRA